MEEGGKGDGGHIGRRRRGPIALSKRKKTAARRIRGGGSVVEEREVYFSFLLTWINKDKSSIRMKRVGTVVEKKARPVRGIT